VWTNFGRYNALFRALIDQVWEQYPRLLPEAVDTSDFSLWRSPRQGAVLETTNRNVAEKIITGQLLLQEGGDQGLSGRPPYEAGLHTGQEHLAHHSEVLQGALTDETSLSFFRGGFNELTLSHV
jgi:hypothetical protein